MPDSAVFISNRVPDAPSTTPYQRLNSLSDEFDLTVFTLHKLPSDFQDQVTASSASGGIIYKIFFPLWVVYQVFKSGEEYRFVYTSYNKPALLTGILLKLFGYPWVADIYDDPLLGLQLARLEWKDPDIDISLYQIAIYLYWAVSLKIIKRTIRFTDFIIFVPELIEDYGFSEDDDKVLSITNGVDCKLTETATPIPRENFTVFYVGHVQKQRGVGELLEAAEIVKSRGYDDIQFEFVGPVPDSHSEMLEAELEARSVSNTVSFLGRRPHEEALNRMASSDVCVCILSPEIRNYRRTYPIKLFEYMAMGTAIIASDFRGIGNVIDHEETGLLVPPNRPDVIADNIIKLYENPEFKIIIGQEAKIKAKKYDWENINEDVISGIKARI
ncbi:glycosyltransferase [Halobellus sp. Atlit-38R]|uniref:glycosyltransferase n=1 Tax=Halobellus sp. Atlit-38R TaxID=2282131 RepID=UPI000EF23547|nr:glycosyltransferase [Halobellus sp. Atlit-38R]RLM83887.1 glycosyltransferase [Halobellus sp. Atlit-38R]